MKRWIDDNEDMEDFKPDPKDVVTAMPKGFTEWMNGNAERVANAAKAGTLPYFLKDNKWAMKADGSAIGTGSASLDGVPSDNSLLNAKNGKKNADEDWEKRKLANWEEYDTQSFNWTEEERKRMAEYWKDLENKLGIGKGDPKTPEQADLSSANPDYHVNISYQVNCQTCVPTYLLRTFGFNVKATPRSPGSLNDWIAQHHLFDIFETIDGKTPKPILYENYASKNNRQEWNSSKLKSFFHDTCSAQGIYAVTIRQNGGFGHATILQRTLSGLYYVEPQLNLNRAKSALRPLSELIRKMSKYQPAPYGLMRIDNLKIKDEYLSIFAKADK